MLKGKQIARVAGFGGNGCRGLGPAAAGVRWAGAAGRAPHRRAFPLHLADGHDGPR